MDESAYRRQNCSRHSEPVSWHMPDTKKKNGKRKESMERRAEIEFRNVYKYVQGMPDNVCAF